MDIKVHRGLEQIGGCITEISTATSRVFIDFGQNLPGNGEITTPEQDKLMVESIFACNTTSNLFKSSMYLYIHYSKPLRGFAISFSMLCLTHQTA